MNPEQRSMHGSSMHAGELSDAFAGFIPRNGPDPVESAPVDHLWVPPGCGAKSGG